MSGQDRPTWYPSRQVTHTPPVPGAPASLGDPDAPRPEDATPPGLWQRLRRALGGRRRPTSVA